MTLEEYMEYAKRIRIQGFSDELAGQPMLLFIRPASKVYRNYYAFGAVCHNVFPRSSRA